MDIHILQVYYFHLYLVLNLDFIKHYVPVGIKETKKKKKKKKIKF